MSAAIKWDVSPRDGALINKIVERAMAIYEKNDIGRDAMDITMDIEACHLNGCPLRLAEMLVADDFNFMHDIGGINRHLNRQTGKLMNCFLPRFAKPARRRVAK